MFAESGVLLMAFFDHLSYLSSLSSYVTHGLQMSGRYYLEDTGFYVWLQLTIASS